MNTERYTVCIADDEEYIVKGIERRIEQSKFNLEVVGTAANGEEAYTLFEKEKPDIFFVDVRMPGYDGLEFIEHVRRMHEESRTKFIIISGFDDFSYLQRAIRTSVVNYIMKPIVQKEFTDTLRETCKRIDIERERLEEAEGKKQNYWEDMEVLREGFEGTVLLICRTGCDMKRKPVNIGNYAVIRKLFSPNRWSIYYFHGVDNALLLLGKGVFSSTEYMMNVWKELSSYIPARMVWTNAHGSNQLSKRTPEELEQTLYSYFWNKSSHVFEAQKGEESEVKVNLMPLNQAFEHSREAFIREEVQKIAAAVFADKRYKSSLIQIHHSIMVLYANQYTKYHISIPDEIKEELTFLALSTHADSRELTDAWITYGEHLLKEISEQTRERDIVDHVMEYLEQHYAEDINLSNLAAEFFLAPNYLARRFKEKKNMTAMQYLENYRIQLAKEYLKHSSRSIADIATEVGYSDANYFTRTFKKNCGLSPREYRTK